MEKVKKLRKEVGMKQCELARMLGIVHQTFSNIESGYYSPKNKELTKEKAVDILYPLLIKKIIKQREELERLETFSLQFRRI